MKKQNHSRLGFSLVEVTLALGMVVFCLVTIMGLLALGITSAHAAAVQTSAANILTAVAADLESTPDPLPKGASAQTSPLYGITLPKAANVTPTITSPLPAPTATIYIGEDGQVVTSANSAYYRLSVWTTASNTGTGAAPIRQETLVRLLISWPALAPYAAPQGSLDNVIALNRN